ncbi:biofilm regulation protein kinase SiaB [Crenobacter sp. SG2303]|uniref:Biofilm regulation protein kinase SiaB n=1 Tax=Crenobacter oryzisoli TaxID=3056844 RepID=A0ABT7XUF8_9NEIS|nr:biofilm regulation protein kinase SiaB [Crenobacter sp. SG2303]MDN0077427.1 biofilm regulation protein kinase SiaB [Crenobacter sp. SG2303]
MERVDVQTLRDAFIRQGIMLCFNGPFSATLIEEIGQALRKHMEGLSESQSSVTDVFTAYIELTQNIRHYTAQAGLTGVDAQATLTVSRNGEGRYVVDAGNVVKAADGAALVDRIESLAGLDKAELKAAFKAQLRQPRDPEAKTGAGLGLIDLARRSSEPLSCSLTPLNDGFSFFSLRVVI